MRLTCALAGIYYPDDNKFKRRARQIRLEFIVIKSGVLALAFHILLSFLSWVRAEKKVPPNSPKCYSAGRRRW